MVIIVFKVYYIFMYKEEVEVDLVIEVINDNLVEIVGDDRVNKLILKN